MSIDFGSRQFDSGKRVAAQQLAMAAAGALAFSLLVSGVATRENSTAMSLSQSPRSAESVHRQLPALTWSQPATTIYVVESEADAQLLQAGIASVAGTDVTGHLMQVVVAGTPEQIELLVLLQSELGQLDNTSIVDLRYSGALDGLRPR